MNNFVINTGYMLLSPYWNQSASMV
jgi:hypothetical protein